MKKFICGIIFGVILTVGVVFAIEYEITPNPYKILVNGKETSLEAYNINGRTYLQLRDIAKTLEGVSVDFKEDIILIDSVKNNMPNYNTSTEVLNTPSRIVDDITVYTVQGKDYVRIYDINKKLENKGSALMIAFQGIVYDTSKSPPNDIYKGLPDGGWFKGGTPLEIYVEGVMLSDKTLSDGTPALAWCCSLDYYYSTILPWIESLTAE